jgi:hypothetical protein
MLDNFVEFLWPQDDSAGGLIELSGRLIETICHMDTDHRRPLIWNFRFGPLFRGSYASAALDTTNSPSEQNPTGTARSWGPTADNRGNRRSEVLL